MKKIYCSMDFNDYLDVDSDEQYAFITIQCGNRSADIALSPSKIRKLRKHLKRALIEIEGNDIGTGNPCGCNDCVEVDEKEEWIPKPGDLVRFVDDKTLDYLDEDGWKPKKGEIYVVKHFYEANGDEFLYHGISLEETPKAKSTCLDYGYKFRLSGFEPA